MSRRGRGGRRRGPTPHRPVVRRSWTQLCSGRGRSGQTGVQEPGCAECGRAVRPTTADGAGGRDTQNLCRARPRPKTDQVEVPESSQTHGTDPGRCVTRRMSAFSPVAVDLHGTLLHPSPGSRHRGTSQRLPPTGLSVDFPTRHKHGHEGPAPYPTSLGHLVDTPLGRETSLATLYRVDGRRDHSTRDLSPPSVTMERAKRLRRLLV